MCFYGHFGGQELPLISTNLSNEILALAGVVQWLEGWPEHQKGHRFYSLSRSHTWVTGFIPGLSQSR